MRRLFCTSVLLSLFAPALVALPVAAEPVRNRPHPVSPTLTTLTEPSGTATFSTIGATWDRGAKGRVELRTRTAGRWSGWTALEAYDAGPDTGSTDAATASGQVVSGPVWVGSSNAYQTRTVGGAVRGLKVVVVDAGTSTADADPTGAPTGPGVASAAAVQPAVYTRAQWGADESLRSFNGSGCTTPDYGSTVKVGFVHHTDGANTYTANETPAVIRGIYAYHVKTNGWCDIGYNFLVDQFGRTWEGRYGGIDRPVIGAHTGGHNVNTFGAALLGTFTTTQPSPRMLSALQKLYAWKLARNYADPTGTAQLTSAGGGTSRYAAGTTNTFDVISAHRDAGYTACPGDAGFATMGDTRSAVKVLMGAGLVNPRSSARTAAAGGSGVTVAAGVLKTQQWSLDVRRKSDQVLVRTYTGATSTSLSQPVDLKDGAGVNLPAGAYTLTLSSNAASEVAVPWIGALDITSSSPPPPPAPAVTTFTPVTPARVLDTRSGLGSSIGATPIPAKGRVTVKVTGVGGVPASGVSAVAVNLTGIAHGGPTYLAAYPADTAWPGTSSLNLAKDQTHASLVVPRVGADGSVSVYNAAATSDAVLDVVGYFTASGGSSYTPVVPSRLVDTRTTTTPYVNNETRTVQVAGRAGVPSDATAVVANITVTGTSGAGLATVYPAAAQRPTTSTLNFGTGEVASNRFVSGLSGGKLSVYAQVARADVLIDVVGYFSGSGGTAFTPVTPSRILDTREANGVPGRTPVAGGSTTVVPVAGRGGVPADAKAVVMTLTTTGITRNGYVTAWSGVGARPGVSDVNTWTGHTVANLVVVQLGAGNVSLFNAGNSATLVGDVLGYFR